MTSRSSGSQRLRAREKVLRRSSPEANHHDTTTRPHVSSIIGTTPFLLARIPFWSLDFREPQTPEWYL